MMLPDLLGILIGFCSGILSGMLGIGGGMVMVPAMVLALHVPQHTAQGISLAVIVLTASTGTIAHWRYGNVNWRIALWIAPAAAISAVIGARFAGMLDPVLLRRIFAVVIIIFGVRMLLRR